MLKKVLLLVAVAISFDVHAGAQAVPLADPPVVAVPPSTPAAVVEKAIIGASVRRGWDVIERKPAEVRLRYAKRGFWVTIRALYDSNGVAIKYVDSDNLDYDAGNTGPVSQVGEGGVPTGHPLYNRPGNVERRGVADGVPVIHPNYNRWVNNLARDISNELTLGSIR